jgi:hypothetical protein
MGAWGIDIFDDDLTLDVKGDYEDILDSGLSHEQVTKKLIDRYHDALADSDESSLFWLALAAIQLEHGALITAVKKNALNAIDSDPDLLRWKDSPDAHKRRQILEQLKNQILQDS